MKPGTVSGRFHVPAHGLGVVRSKVPRIAVPSNRRLVPCKPRGDVPGGDAVTRSNIIRFRPRAPSKQELEGLPLDDPQLEPGHETADVSAVLRVRDPE